MYVSIAIIRKSENSKYCQGHRKKSYKLVVEILAYIATVITENRKEVPQKIKSWAGIWCSDYDTAWDTTLIPHQVCPGSSPGSAPIFSFLE